MFPGYLIVLKYIFEAFGIAFVSKYVMGHKGTAQDVIALTVTITLCMLILDMWTPGIGAYARQGAGFGLGMRQIGGCGCDIKDVKGGTDLIERMDDPVAYDYYINDSIPSHGIADNKNSLYDTLIASHLSPPTAKPVKTATKDTHEGMDDPIAEYYYNHNGTPPTQGVAPGHPIYDTLIATRLEAPQVNVMERFLDGSRMWGQKGGASPSQLAVNAAAPASEPVPVGLSSDTVSSAGTSSANNTGQTPGERGLVFGVLDQSLQKNQQQKLYSSALIELRVNERKLILDTNGKYVQLEDLQEQPMVTDQLFKLRFILVKPNTKDNKGLQEIRYGDLVYLAFNDNQSNTVLLNHNGDLNALKSSDTKFMLLKKSNPLYRGPVSTQDQILVGTNVDTYLKSASNGRINTGSSLTEASIFKVTSQKGCGPLWRYEM